MGINAAQRLDGSISQQGGPSGEIFIGHLVGPQGPPGPAGAPGPQGPPGNDYVITDEDKLEIAGIVLNTETLKKLQNDVADLKYVPISIGSFTNDVGLRELGFGLISVNLSWTLNKEPASQEIDGITVEPTARSYRYISETVITTDRNFTLKVTDERHTENTKTTSIRFVNGIYYGVLGITAPLNSASILTLTKKLQTGRGITFTAKPTDGKRPTYACPERYGTPKFTIGGFEYSWNKLATIEFTNIVGYTERYDVWQHPQDVTGSLEITVS